MIQQLGNDSGIKQMAVGYYEYVAGINQTISSETIKGYNTYIINAEAKYKDEYNGGTNSRDIPNDGNLYKPGDATYETQNWKGVPFSYFVYPSLPVFCRSFYGMFYCNGDDGSGFVRTGSRAALVCGAGF